jgi:DNA-binding response OmpR family regulator
MTARKNFDVFLSHNSIDKPWVIRLKKALQDRGLKVWLDRDEIRPGDIFVGALEAGLEKSKAVVLIVSPEAIASGWIKDEYARAVSLAHQKNQPLQLIPVILRDAEIPGFLANRSWVDFRDESSFDENLELLIWGITGKRLTAQASNPHQEHSNKKPQILIIEDDRNWQGLLRDILEDQMGYHADIAGDQTIAKQLWDTPTHYDLAIIDACLDQEEFTLSCQQFFAYLHTKRPEVPLVAITGRPIIGRGAFILSKYGVVDFIEKGRTDLPDIQQRITSYLSKANPNSHIFISYRHGSGAEYAWRLYDHLASHFGKSNVLIDVHQADEDTDSASDIQTALDKCQTILVVIGQQWTSMTDNHGYQLLSNENDHVRREVSSALKRNMRIIPVLVENATLPQKKDLPDDLRGLTDCKAVSIVNQRDLHEPLQYLISLCKGELSYDKH